MLITLFAAACSNKKVDEHTAAAINSNAKKWVAKNLADTPGYKPVNFSSIDSIVLSYRNDSAYIRLEDSIMQIEALRFQEMGENFKLFTARKQSGYYEKKQAGFRQQQIAIMNTMKPKFVGYKLDHHFTVTDSSGAALLNKYILCFDRDGNLTGVLR
ncbi:hypothetical protein LT679_07530 [Mucilaginibacter roseus]|uniref:Beta-lactamase-inhibitor-like PepSY-like domain-containing protein n=1 Tax=Mucilaginibacter roseus TaxID=1528868 RepID=A0ABS8U014_9SPHI|nr:hypothetical protein [Mucilaginibacter roseus]MCD8740449.1 hypothetical protein [Mucilaginibacter roseus]